MLVTKVFTRPMPVKRCSSVPKAIEILTCLSKTQDGTWVSGTYDPYMHGLSNGLRCALACLTGKDPEYLNAPNVETSSSEDNRNTLLKDIEKLLEVCTAEKEQVKLSTAYSLFRRAGITGFKTPKMSKNKQIKTLALKTKSKTYVLRLELNKTKNTITYQCFSPGKENYSYKKETRKTVDSKNFLQQLLKVVGLKEHHAGFTKALESL